jgi:hypothetical protein
MVAILCSLQHCSSIGNDYVHWFSPLWFEGDICIRSAHTVGQARQLMLGELSIAPGRWCIQSAQIGFSNQCWVKGWSPRLRPR